MSIQIYHQVGFRDKWNVDSFTQDGCGSGLILSPVHQSRDFVEDLPDTLRRHCLFDPQYYLPNSPKAKLGTYPFFPQKLTGGFSTKDFALVALESAERCVQFQIEQEFGGIVIPSRLQDQMIPRYFERHEEATVLPFLSVLAKAGSTKPVYLTLPVTSAMLMEEDFRIQLLNWVTGFPEVSAIYLLVSDDRSSKQIKSAELVFSYLSFAQEVRNTGLGLLLGHQNSESLLFTVVEGALLTFGAYENTRIFSLDKFIDSDEERRSPKARIYLPALLNWIQFDQAMQIRESDPDLWQEIYSPTRYSDQVIARGQDPHFTQPDLYKHHFECMNTQIKKLGRMTVEARSEAVRQSIRTAIDLNSRIADIPLLLDPHGRGDHLRPWLEGLERFHSRFPSG